jgi:predicted PurR-regulated permease PerM
MRAKRYRLEKSNSFGARTFRLSVAAVLAYLTFRILAPFLSNILWAFLLAFLLFPVTRRIRRLTGERRGLAASLMTVGVTIGVIGPAITVAVAFVRQAADLVQKLSQMASRYQIAGVEDLLKLPLVGSVVGWLEAHFPLDAARIHGWLLDGLRAAIQFLVAHSGTAVAGALGILADLALTLFVLFFFFRDGDGMVETSIQVLPVEAGRKKELVTYLDDVIRAVVVGTVLTAVVQGSLIGVAFWITGLPSPVVFGALAMVASFVPFVGTGLVVVPAVLYLWAGGVVWKTVFMLVWGAVVAGSADNFLRPLLISGRARIGTLTVLFGVLGGLAAFGLIGLFLGPVVLSLVLSLIRWSRDVSSAAPARAEPPAESAAGLGP